MMNRVYVLVTPVKDEELNLRDAATGIMSQSEPPSLWVIVDDGSKDRTPEVIRDVMNQQNWIIGLRLPEHPRDVYQHYAEVCMKGFDHAIEYSKKHDIDFEFVGLVDADTILDRDHFKRLMNEFQMNRKLGIASGGLYYEKDGRMLLEITDNVSPRGTGRLWRKDCFFETGGYALLPAPPDSISNIKAVIHGYEVKQFRSIAAIQMRPTSSAGGLWKGYEERGRALYFMNAHPLIVLMNMVNSSIQEPHFKGLAFLVGYVRAFVERMEKIADGEIREYYWKVRPKLALKEALNRTEG
jgi:glycosyltransferase involved in cell wall biosynthesis